jgi:hypothetical protein
MIPVSNAMLENKAIYMEMFKNGDYTVFENMLYSDFKRLMDWKINFEKEKKQQMEESMAETKKNTSRRSYTRKK